MMPRCLAFHGSTWRINIEIVYLPQASIEWWQNLLRATAGAFDRQDGLKTLLECIQSPTLISDYLASIPRNANARTLYRTNHGWRCTVPSLGQLNMFERRLPKVVRLLEEELNKH